MNACLWRGARGALAGSLLLGLIPASPAHADWSSTSSTQVILRVDPSQGTAKASGASYAIQGSGLAGTPVLNSGAAPTPGLALQPVEAGASFQLNMGVKPADAQPGSLPPNTLPAFSEVTVVQSGTANGLAGQVLSPTSGSAVAGGPGSSATLTQSNTFTVFP
jgi:hypothetical protein